MSRKNEDGIYVNRDCLVCDRWSFEDSAESVKAYIDSIVEKAKEKGMVGDGRFHFSPASGYYEGEYVLDVYYLFDRVETEKEKEKRKEAAAAKRKATAEKKRLKADAEYAEFLRLKEKFKELSE